MSWSLAQPICEKDEMEVDEDLLSLALAPRLIQSLCTPPDSCAG